MLTKNAEKNILKTNNEFHSLWKIKKEADMKNCPDERTSYKRHKKCVNNYRFTIDRED